jgi:hypothetical protein
VQAEASASEGKWAVTVTDVTSLLVAGNVERTRGCTEARGCRAEVLHSRKARKAAATAKRRGPRLTRQWEGAIGEVDWAVRWWVGLGEVGWGVVEGLGPWAARLCYWALWLVSRGGL